MMEDKNKYGLYVNGIRICTVTETSIPCLPPIREELQAEFNKALEKEQYEKLREITDKAKRFNIELDLP